MNGTQHRWLFMLGVMVCSPCFAASTNAPARTEYAFFKLIPERNIFNPARVAHHFQTTPADSGTSTPTDAFVLVGTMAYAKGTFAFFSGPTTNYQKVLPCHGEIAGFKLTAIQPEAVILTTSNRTLALHVGAQLQRNAETGWTLVPNVLTQGADQVISPAPPPPANDPVAPANDILKKLMQKREQELQ